MARLRAIEAIQVIGDDSAGIELAGAVPDLDVSLLNDLLGEILSPQDTEHDAEEFRARGGVKALESGLIPLRNRGNQPDQLSWRQHSASPKSRSPSRLTPGAIEKSRSIPCAKRGHQVAGLWTSDQ